MRSAVLFLAFSLSIPLVAAAASFHDQGSQDQHGRKEMPQSSGTAADQSSWSSLDADSTTAKSLDQPESAKLLKADRDRHSQAVEDARRLAELSRELQQDLEHAGTQAMPVESLQKADEIIKLAKNLKGRMRAF